MHIVRSMYESFSQHEQKGKTVTGLSLTGLNTRQTFLLIRCSLVHSCNRTLSSLGTF